MSTGLSSSLEDYLEAIYKIKQNEGRISITNISTMLDVRKSSVNSAIKKLKSLDYVIHEKYEEIILTGKGEEAAKRVKAKHDVLFKFLSCFLGVPDKKAAEEACKIEHSISETTFESLERFIDLLEKSPGFRAEERNGFSEEP